MEKVQAISSSSLNRFHGDHPVSVNICHVEAAVANSTICQQPSHLVRFIITLFVQHKFLRGKKIYMRSHLEPMISQEFLYRFGYQKKKY